MVIGKHKTDCICSTVNKFAHTQRDANDARLGQQRPSVVVYLYNFIELWHINID